MEIKPQLPQIFTVKSSAGAGKTYRLAQHYIALLLLDTLSGKPAKNHIANLVAITFTNKAAQEMRGRIIEWMKRIIFDVPFENSSRTALDEVMDNEWLKNNPEFKRDTVRETIANNFDDLLKNYYSFNVSTIDSFVNLILKASAFKLNLPPDFDISLESSSMIDLALRECLQKISEDAPVRVVFDRFIDNYIETEGNNVSWLPKDLLKNIISSLWNEELKENKDFIVNRHSRALVGDLRKQIEETAQKLKEAITENPDILPRSDFLKAVDACIDIIGNEPGRGVSFQKQSLNTCFKKGSCSANASQETLWQDLIKLRAPFVEAVSESKFTSYIEVYDLFKEMLTTEVTYRKRLILIEQLNRLLQDVMRKTDFVPEIYYALSERYTHFLIDEFQDTNHLQWKNIEVLTEEAIARGGTLFLVGDKKQAIYRWRGGKSELVDEVADHYSAYRIDGQSLTTNYRSDGEIVSFNNTVFSAENLAAIVNTILKEDSEDLKEKILRTYRDSKQQPLDDRKDQGYVYVEKIIAEEEDGGIKDVFTKMERSEIVTEKFKTLISRIRGRGVFQDKDIAVLVRRKDEAQLIVRALLELGINVESELTVNVKNNPLVKELISFLHFINAPDDDLSFASFISGTIFQTKTGTPTKEIIEWLTEKRTASDIQHLYSAFRGNYPKVWEDCFEDFFKKSGYLPLYEFVVLFLKKWSLFSNFPDEVPYFLHICELIKNNEASEENNLSAFLRSLDGNSKTSFANTSDSEKSFLLKTSEAANAIKVLTIHKAKGLQFPVVILPFMKLNSFSASDERDKTKFFRTDGDTLKLLYIKKDFTDISPKLNAMYRERETAYLLDELNNTYVACTRAEKELYIFLTDSRGYKKNYLIDYLFNLDFLKNHIHGDLIETGTLRQPSAPYEGLQDEGAAVSFADQFTGDDLGNDIRWLTKIKTKFEEAAHISRQQLYAKKKGDVIHYILSLVHTLSENSNALLDTCVMAGIAKYHFSTHTEAIRKIIVNFFTNAQFMQFFKPYEGDIVFTEKEIIDEKGVVYKIDRMIVHNDNTIDIIDFKSGESQIEEHREQISRYRQLVRRMYPGKDVRRHLLYIEENMVITL
jgi:ATP-dependent helicase/nuclease subunit A